MDAKLLALAAENIRRERDNEAIQTSLVEWAEQAEFDARMREAVQEVEIDKEPREWSDVVSFGPAAVIGFLVKRGGDILVVQ